MLTELHTAFQESVLEVTISNAAGELLSHRLSEPAHEVDLAELWADLIGGRHFMHDARYVKGRCFVIFEKCHRTPLASQSRQILERALSGERLKVLSIELGLSPATISQRCSSALSTLGYESRLWRVPVLLVAAAHAARGMTVPCAVRLPLSPGDGFVVSCALPGVGWELHLSRSEYEVAKFMIEGKSHEEIALARQTAKRTIANQISSIFRKLGLSGRSELRARAILDEAGGHVPRDLLRVPVRQSPWHRIEPDDCGRDAR